MPPDERARPPGPTPRVAGPPAAKPKVTGRSLTDWTEHRRRQLHRLAVIAQVRAAYGLDADLRLTPPGPDCCPVDCPVCLAVG
jgi:hypothetical protein